MTNNEYGVIVAGVDGSEESIAALLWAIDEARLRNADVVALMALAIPWTIMISGSYTESDYARDARATLDKSVDKIIAEHSDVKITKTFIQRKASLALTEAAQNADLLVVGSHGYSSMPGMNIGSVANYCVNHSPAPVVVHRTR